MFKKSQAKTDGAMIKFLIQQRYKIFLNLVSCLIPIELSFNFDNGYKSANE
jgi:hypothetical protein